MSRTMACKTLSADAWDTVKGAGSAVADKAGMSEGLMASQDLKGEGANAVTEGAKSVGGALKDGAETVGW